MTKPEMKFAVMKMKCVLDPIFSIPIGQVCDEMIAPMEEPAAAMFKPFARKSVGKISDPYTQAAGPKPIEKAMVYTKMNAIQV